MAGLLVIFGVWLLDYKLHVDDPVGAVAVHMMNGIWGTVAVGLFATDSAPGFAIAGIKEGVFYGGGFEQLGKQFGGMGITIIWTIITITIAFLILKSTIGLRVSAEEEIIGLDKLEHGLSSSYAGFSISYTQEEVEEAKEAGIAIPETAPASKDVPAHKVVIITRQSKFDALKTAMNDIGVTGMTVVNVMGCGMQKGAAEYYRGAPVAMSLLPKIKVEIVVSKVPVETVVEVAKKALYTGHIGDGKIFVYPVDNVVKVRTGESGYDALQDEE